MGIAGAALYSLALLALRELAQFRSQATRTLRWTWQLLVDSAAHRGASLHVAPPQVHQSNHNR